MLAVVLLHDREELVGQCLWTMLSKAGLDFRLSIVCDNPDFDPEPYREMFTPEHWDVTTETVGPGTARNIGIAHREPGEDCVHIDSDLTFLTDDWLASLKGTLDMGYAAVSAVIGDPGPPWFHRVAPNQGVVTIRSLPVGCRLVSGATIDALGGYRRFGPTYGLEDVDYDARIKFSGWKMAYNTDVVVRHPGYPADEWEKRLMCKEGLHNYRQVEKEYPLGRYLYQALDEPNNFVGRPGR